MKKRVLSPLLALALCLGLLSGTARADGGFLSGSADASGEGWTWDHTTHTMTLRGYRGGDILYSAEHGEALTLVLADGTSNTVTGGIETGNLVIRGGGSLLVDGDQRRSGGIHCENFTMESGTVEVVNMGGNDNLIVNDQRYFLTAVPIACASSFTVTGGTLKLSRLNGAAISLSNCALSLVGDPADGWPDTLLASTGDLSLRNCSVTFTGPMKSSLLVHCLGNFTLENTALGWSEDQCSYNFRHISIAGTAAVSGLPPHSYGLGQNRAGGYSLDLFAAANSGVALPAPAAPVAYASTQTVKIDGVPVTFYAYALKDASGNDTNYVKLRDVAQALNGSAAQFEVGWGDGGIAMETGKPYTPNGSEMVQSFSGDQPYAPNAAAIQIDGKAVALSAITLTDAQGGAYTYFKLRDLGDALGFTVDWTAADGIVILTR